MLSTYIMKKFKFIYFDVGGVVILDFSGTNKWNDMLSSMGVNDSNKDRFDIVWHKYKDKICIDYDVDSMIPELRDYVGLHLSKNFSFLHEFISRFDSNASLWPVIEYAKQNYSIGLLTSMYPRMLDGISQTSNLMPKVDWDVVVDSSIVRLQKPDPKLYDLAQKLSGIKDPEDILFIDNVEKNLEYPKELGWQTFYYDSTRPLESSESLLKLITLQ
jgi:FMN phosphatase YigB (HAD superfamily)